jgi:glycosyltransferase involved in cell wall biosynthesis
VRWQEPFGLVPLEAMASGTPVIAAASGGAAAHLRDGRTALVVPPDDPAALASAVRRLRRDHDLRATLRAEGRRTAERYPAERSLALVTAALEESSRVRPVTPR